MALYWQADGTDDRALTPSIPFDKVEVTLRRTGSPSITSQQRIWSLPFGANFLMVANNNLDISNGTLTVDGVVFVDNSSFSTFHNKKVTIVANIPKVTNTVHIFCNNGNSAFFPGDLYEIKFFDGNTLSAHYDMATQSFNDQSGNGRHATVFGGVWVDDGEGGGTGGGTEPEPTPIPISAQFPTRQAIFKPTSININTEQTIFKNVSESYSTTQAIYKQINTSHLTNQQIYKPIAEQFGTKQIVSKLITEQFSTKQSIYKRVSFDFPIGIVITALTNYVASFPIEQIIYKQIVSDNPTNQAVYKSISESTPTEQNIFKQMSYEFKTAQQIFKRVINDTAIKQVIYKHVSDNNPLQIRIIIPGAPELIGVIRLQGKRELFAYLQGKRELTIHLKGGLNMIKNQNFSMISGDTKTIVIDINENLVGAAAKWSMKKRGATTTTLIKNGTVADGKIQIVLDKADTEELSGLFMHECEVTDQSGNVSTVTSGAVNIQADMI